MTVGFRERRSGSVLSQKCFERGHAETEASETNDGERHKIDPAADAGGVGGPGDLGTAWDQQDDGCDLPAAGTAGRAELAVAKQL